MKKTTNSNNIKKKTSSTNSKTSNNNKIKENQKNSNKKPTNKISENSISTSSTKTYNSIKKEINNEISENKIKFDFNTLKHTSILTNQKVDSYLYLELMNNLDKKDDIKSLAICRLILAQDPNNEKIKELNDLLFKSIEKSYKENGNQLVENKEEPMDKHMKLNKDGEYEYFSSDEESN